MISGIFGAILELLGNIFGPEGRERRRRRRRRLRRRGMDGGGGG